MKDFNLLTGNILLKIISFLNNKMLPSYSFGAEGVEYGRKAPFYVPSSGPLALPSDLEVKGNLRVDGTSTLVGAASVGGPFSVGTGGVSTSGSLLTGSSTTPGGAIFGYDGSSVRAPNFPRGLQTQSGVTITEGATGGVPGLEVTNAGIGGAPLRRVRVFNDQASPGTLISMQNGADAGTLAYDGTAFQLTRPLTIPVQTGSSGNLTVGGELIVPEIVGPASSLPNFPLGLLIGGQALSTGITSASSAGSNNSWWVKFKAPGGTNSFALIGGAGQFSGGTNGGMTIFGPPFTSVIATAGSGIKGQTLIVLHDTGGDNGPNGEVKFYAVDLAGNPVGTGAIVNGLALVLCPP